MTHCGFLGAENGRGWPAASFYQISLGCLLISRAIPHNSKCRYGERGAADAKPKAQIILDAAKVSAASGGNSEPKQGQRSQSARGFLPPKHDAGTATRHYRAFWQRRCRAAAAGAVLKPQGGNCAVLPKVVSLRFVRAVFQQVSGLAVQRFAQGFQGGKPHRFCFCFFRMERLAGVMPMVSASSPAPCGALPSSHPG